MSNLAAQRLPVFEKFIGDLRAVWAAEADDRRRMEKAKPLLPNANVTYLDDMNAVAEGCDAIVVATEWDEFKQLDLARAKAAMTAPIMFDGRNLFDPKEMEKLGWTYKSVGR